jgi:hypothetical protein
MKSNCKGLLRTCLLAITLVSPAAHAHADDEIEQLKQQIQVLIERVSELERTRGQAAPTVQSPVPASASDDPTPAIVAEREATPPPSVEGNASPIRDRASLRDEQQAAPRPDDLTLDPKYRGFIGVPNTPVLIKFNAKPRVDASYDSRNSGDDNRFVTAKIPVSGEADYDNDGAFNINAKGSQLRIDVRAPTVAGSPRFYYENDFYGSGGGEFPYRIRHLYGQIYNIIVGQTYSIFEDPDVWPDTVDYEGPNSAVFARRPLIRYQHRIGDEWQVNLGIEQPDSEVDFTGVDADASGNNQAPDGGANVRWERADIGHVQFATLLRDIGVEGPITGDQNVLGWGLNLTGGFNVFGRDSLQTQLTYGQGIFRFINDDFQNLDAAFDATGELEPIPYFGAMFGYTHRWSDALRTTVSYGYATVDNQFSQAGDAYHETHYGSVNLIWQIRQRLSVGLEELYGRKETVDGSDGDVFRTQLGLVYQIFD